MSSPSPVRAQDAPFPAGISSQTLEGLKCSVVMPENWSADREWSLMVILHGAGGTETGMSHALAFLAEHEFCVVAPKSKGQTWAKADLDAVRKIVADLKKRLKVGEGRLHGAGFSNGGWNLGPVALDPALRFRSACWIAAGFRGGKVPPHGKKEMGVLALAGMQDGNRNAAEQTPKLLRKKVRSAMVRLQPDLGHEWPEALMPFYGWWLEVQEGRYEPGRTFAFDWMTDEETALAVLGENRKGGVAYWFDETDKDDAVAKRVQNDVLMDPLVQHFGGQLVAWRMDRAKHAARFAELKLKETPAVVVFKPNGKVAKTLQGKKVSPGSLAKVLRSVAPDKKMPEK
ncbi:MAG: hypothetical protein ACYTG4_11295 [Planctomycetota bacterium]